MEIQQHVKTLLEQLRGHAKLQMLLKQQPFPSYGYALLCTNRIAFAEEFQKATDFFTHVQVSKASEAVSMRRHWDDSFCIRREDLRRDKDLAAGWGGRGSRRLRREG